MLVDAAAPSDALWEVVALAREFPSTPFIAIVPLHLVYGFVFLDVFAVRELHPAIAGFPESRLAS